MPTRYKSKDIVLNRSEYYAPLRRSRDLKVIRQYGTVMLRQPTIADRSRVTSDTHLWSYGDRLYTLANTYYGDARYWWVIAWWNGYPTESDIATGVVLTIPTNIEKALKALGF